MDSEATTYPLKIGPNFKVSWSGVLDCYGADIDEADITNADIDVATINNVDIYDAKIEVAEIEDVDIDNARITDATINRVEITNAKIEVAEIEDVDIDNARITDATIDDVKITNAEIEIAEIKDVDVTDARVVDITAKNMNATTVTITDATITDVDLYGTITGTNWNITPQGVAKFGNWSFNGSVMSNAGNEIRLSGGSLALDCAGALNIFATTITSTADANFGGLTLRGVVDVEDKLNNHESRLEALEDELVAARARIVALTSSLEAAWEEADYWESRYNNHTCPEPDPGPNTGGSE